MFLFVSLLRAYENYGLAESAVSLWCNAGHLFYLFQLTKWLKCHFSPKWMTRGFFSISPFCLRYLFCFHTNTIFTRVGLPFNGNQICRFAFWICNSTENRESTNWLNRLPYSLQQLLGKITQNNVQGSKTR